MAIRVAMILGIAWLSALPLQAMVQAQGLDCTNPQTQTDMDVCASQDFSKADAAMNAVYTQLLANVTPAGKISLRDAQRAWLAYRDKQCAFETAGTLGASVHPMVLALCREDLTRAQTARLMAQRDCQEGNLSCGRQ